MAVSLFDYQMKAVEKLRNGSVLVGGVGTGKSRTALGYFFALHGGKFEPDYHPMKEPVRDLYIITTARKRDTLEWDSELTVYLMSRDPSVSAYKNKVVVDSWNNIGKYINVEGAFFIFDEQRVVGSGAWVDAFKKIARKNHWILLSATPGDTWLDYAPLFIANGFYKNITEFKRLHVVWNQYTKYPKVDHYINVDRLIACRKAILVAMESKKKTVAKHEIIKVEYDRDLYSEVKENKFDIFNDKPCQSISVLCSVLRRIINTDPSRADAVREYNRIHPKLIIFYNYDYELEILRTLAEDHNVPFAEWNGHRHEEIPKADRWFYLVQYTAGAEGWNCIETDSILFYSETYSYKASQQAAGRIDRLTTPFTELYYGHLRSSASIDVAIANCLAKKKNFNERNFVERW